MKTIPKEDRFKFYRFLNAGMSFEQVEHICEYMQSEHIDESHHLYLTLCLSIAVIYGRPFKQRKNIRLPGLIIPKEFLSTHDFLLLTRDKVFAHTDLDGPGYDDESSANELILDARNGKVQAHITSFGIRDTEIERIRKLTMILSKKSAYHADKIWNKYMRKYSFPDGRYKVNIEDKNDCFLLPLNHHEN